MADQDAAGPSPVACGRGTPPSGAQAQVCPSLWHATDTTSQNPGHAEQYNDLSQSNAPQQRTATTTTTTTTSTATTTLTTTTGCYTQHSDAMGETQPLATKQTGRVAQPWRYSAAATKGAQLTATTTTRISPCAPATTTTTNHRPPRNDKIAREAAVEATPMPNDAGAILSPATCKRHITKHPLMPPRNLRCSTHNKHGC